MPPFVRLAILLGVLMIAGFVITQVILPLLRNQKILWKFRKTEQQRIDTLREALAELHLRDEANKLEEQIKLQKQQEK